MARMDLSTPFNRELAVLADRSDGTARDALCEWAYRPKQYPTLCAYVARGITSRQAIVSDAASLAYNARLARLVKQ